MYKGIYIALSGSVQKQGQLDILTHNVANASTVGFKKDRTSFQEFLVSGISGLADSDDGRAMTDLSDVKTDFSAGTQLATNNPLDVALSGKGFLCLEGGRYTRKGDLQIGRERYLVTQDGRKVMGAGGPIQLPDGQVAISPNGEVRVNGTAIDTLKIVDFKNTDSLVELESGQYTTSEAPIPSTATVASGRLEASNVEAVKEMVQMITTLREFEIYQKAIKAFDDAAARVNGEMAKV
ncbi:MAG: flagellar basal-body rod protein FlgF [Deltaproteobacteria bacterium]|nr:flagellar basal-body rod protein FlgF [Deltaproteobacteria bacterium]